MGFSFKIVHGKCMKTVSLSGQHSAGKKKFVSSFIPGEF